MRSIGAADFARAKERGATIRQIAFADYDRAATGLSAWVAPIEVDRASIFARTYGPQNAAVIGCAHAGDITLTGAGAGGDATAVAVLSDLVTIARDRAAIVINKPPGLATQGGTKTDRHVDGLLDALTFDAENRPKLVHRLDKDTSGVLLLARSANAAGHFAKAFSSRTARKVYWALVAGVPPIDDGMIELPIAMSMATSASSRRPSGCSTSR